MAAGLDPAELDVEAVGEHQERARLEVRGDVRVVDRLLGGVRDEDHDHVGDLHGLRDVEDPQARVLGQGPALGPRREADDDVTPLSCRFSAWAWPWLP